MTQVKEEEAVSPAKPIKPKTAVLSVEKQKSQPKRVSIQIYLTNNNVLFLRHRNSGQNAWDKKRVKGLCYKIPMQRFKQLQRKEEPSFKSHPS